MNNQLKRIVTQLSVVFGLVAAIDFIFGMFYYKQLIDANLTLIQISFIVSSFSLFLAIFDFPSGNISDLLGRKKTTAIGIICWGIGLIAFSISQSFNYFILSIIILSLGQALYSGSLTSWLSSYLDTHQQTSFWSSIMAIIAHKRNLFKFVVNGLTLLLFSAISLNYMGIGGFIFIVLGILLLISPYEDNYGKQELHLYALVQDNFSFIKQNKQVRQLMLIQILSAIFFSIFFLSFPFRAIKHFHLSSHTLPYFYFAFNLFILMGSFIYNRLLIKRFQLKTILSLSMILGMFSICLMLLTNNIIMFMISLCLFEWFFIIKQISFNTIEYQYYPDQRKAALTSAISSVTSIFASIYLVVVGVLLKYSLGPLLLISMVLIFGLLTLKTIDLLKRGKHS